MRENGPESAQRFAGVTHRADSSDIPRLRPLIEQVERIADAVEASRSTAEHLGDEAMRDEIRKLRETVAHLRCSTKPLPGRLHPVFARAICAVEEGLRWD